jgi:radical SAM protein with 4Fe4S-binding SPASM domain
LRSNVEELPQISQFCRRTTKDYFRFDPLLHLRFDANPLRNAEIKSERLSPEEIVQIERNDAKRSQTLEKNCAKLINPEFFHLNCDHLFHCGTGLGSFTVSYDGFFRLCSSLWHPECLYDLRKGTLSKAVHEFMPRVRLMRSQRQSYLQNCHSCRLFNLCLWCPAHAHLETGQLDAPVEYFCTVAHARAKAIEPHMAVTAPAHFR